MSYGKLAFIDLNSRRITNATISESIIKYLLGGRGLTSLILYVTTSVSTDPLGDSNPLLVFTGPLTGVIPAGAKTVFAAKSPLSGGLGYSVVGGGLGLNLRKAGYDGLIIVGRAEEPSIIVVEDGDIYLDSAGSMWGMRVYEARKKILEKYGKGFSTAIIGPAGENLVRYAAVIVDEGRAAARTGMATVMGSKKIKAIVARGSKNIEVANPDKIRDLSIKLTKKVLSSPKLESYRKYGTMSLIPIKNQVGDLPSYNHRRGNIDDISRLHPEHAHKVLNIRPGGCRPCPIACGRTVKLNNREFEGLEYETIDSLGPLCGVIDINDVAELNYIVNDLGLDSISIGKCIAWVMECIERGIGLDILPNIRWGDVKKVIEVIQDIAYRRGKAAILAEGIRKAAEIVGGESINYAMHVKGVEIPAQEPRAVKHFGLGHATSNRGADHLYALPCIAYPHNKDEARKYLGLSYEELKELNDGVNPKYKALAVVFSEHLSAVSDALGICKFTTCETLVYDISEICEAIEASIGLQVSPPELLKIGERIVNLERLYLIKLGIVNADQLPSRFIKEALKLPDGRESVIELDYMLREYYMLRNWDSSGIPSEDKLRELGIPELIKLSIRDIISGINAST